MARALVVSGGGAKGAFAVGALEYLLEKQLSFDIVTGTSTGALIAPLVVTGDLTELIDIYTSVTTDNIIRKRQLRNALRSDSVFDTKPLEQLVDSRITSARARAILDSPVTMVLTTVCLQTREITYFYTGPRKLKSPDSPAVRLESRTQIVDAIVASSCQPALMRPVSIPRSGASAKQYCDGGVREYAPLKIAIDNGAQDVYAILLSPDRKPAATESYSNIVSILGRTLSILTEDIGANDIEVARLYNRAALYLSALRLRVRDRWHLDDLALNDLFNIAEQQNPFADTRVLTLHVIRPKDDLGEGLEFDPTEMARMIDLGHSRASQLLNL